MELINLEVELSTKVPVGPVWLLGFNPQYFMAVCTCGDGAWEVEVGG